MIREAFNEAYREEILDNGLKVILWRKPGFKSSSFYLSTPYGSLDYKQIDANGKVIEFPLGIAHFLEHKMFESEDLDIMSFYTSYGSDVNAFTSFDQTTYYFSSTNQDITTELNELLDFVNRLSIDDASVEKEKGIINQELQMYLQNPDSRLYFESLKSLFAQFPYCYDIGGTEDSVNSITTEMLYECHRMNYHPSRMTLLCISDFPDDYLLEIIKDNQNKKEFNQPSKLSRYPYVEENTPAIMNNEVILDVDIPKVAVAYKILTYDIEPMERYLLEMSLRFVLDAYFSTLNPDYQKWLDKKYINSYFNYDVDLGVGNGYLVFFGEGNKDIFVDFIKREVNKMFRNPPNEKTIELLKNKRYGTLLQQFDDLSSLASLFLSYQLCNLDLFDALKKSDEIDLNTIKENINKIKLSEPSVTTINNQ